MLTSPIPLTPTLSPSDGEREKARRTPCHSLIQCQWGWVEGEQGRRTDAAAQNVFGTRETEPQILAALGRNVRAPMVAPCCVRLHFAGLAAS